MEHDNELLACVVVSRDQTIVYGIYPSLKIAQAAVDYIQSRPRIVVYPSNDNTEYRVIKMNPHACLMLCVYTQETLDYWKAKAGLPVITDHG